jgi:phosphate transport system protein
MANAHNPLLEFRMDSLRESLDALAAVVDENLRTVLLRLTCDEAVATEEPLIDIAALARTTRERCLLLVAREHPMAHDLKYAMAVLRVGHDYERVDDLAHALNTRVERLRGTPSQDVIQDMTGVMADILKMHEVVRKTWQRDRNDLSLPNVKPEVDQLAAVVLRGVSDIQVKTLEAVARGDSSPEVLVELVLACRHLKRIANLLQTVPDELHSFDESK